MTPQPGRTLEASCLGKDKLTAEQAKAIAKRARSGSPTAYHCAHCGAWHVGQGNRRDKKAMASRRQYIDRLLDGEAA